MPSEKPRAAAVDAFSKLKPARSLRSLRARVRELSPEPVRSKASIELRRDASDVLSAA